MSDPLEGLSTSWDDDPVIRWFPRANGGLAVGVAYQVEPDRGDTPAKHAQLIFRDVLDLHWSESDVEYLQSNIGEYELSLIEIQPSELIPKMAARRPDEIKPRSECQYGGHAVEDLKHFRIGFDEWGVLDVVCTAVEVSFHHGRTDL